MRHESFAQLDKGAHHVDRDFRGARGVEHHRGHEGTVLGEGERQVLAVLTMSRP